jgi:hypothetical protein
MPLVESLKAIEVLSKTNVRILITAGEATESLK